MTWRNTKGFLVWDKSELGNDFFFMFRTDVTYICHMTFFPIQSEQLKTFGIITVVRFECDSEVTEPFNNSIARIKFRERSVVTLP